MNMSVQHRISILVPVVAVAATVCSAAPANARQAPERRAAVAATSPYATPLDSLGGRAEAQYLAEHMFHVLGPSGV